MTPEPKPKSDKEAKVAAIKPKAKPDSTTTDAEDSDALAKRFEQHFLLNSAGTVARAEAADSFAEGAEALQEKAATIVANTDSKKRDVSSIAQKQIDAFDYLLGSDSGNSERADSSKRKSVVEPSMAKRRRDVVDETTANSLAAFDSLVGAETNNFKHPVIEAAHTVTQQTQHKSAAVDINVADAEALFGAAAELQNSRENRPAAVRTAQTSNDNSTDSEFKWNETRSPRSTVDNAFMQAQTSGSSAGRLRSSARQDHELFQNTAFNAPPVTAGNIEGDDCSIVETNSSHTSVKTAFASHNQDVTARSGRNRSNVIIHPAAAETSLDADVHFTAVPVAPVPELESTVRVAPAGSRPGLIQSLSVRNWMLLIGGIVVIALLFAPGRTKPVTMTNRTANG